MECSLTTTPRLWPYAAATHIPSIATDSSVREAFRILQRCPEGMMLVRDASGSCVGLLTTACIYSFYLAQHGNVDLGRVQVGDVPLHPAGTLEPSAGVGEALERLMEEPVLLLRRERQTEALAVTCMTILSCYGEIFPELSWSKVRQILQPVEEVLDSSLPLGEAADVMMRNRVRTAVIVHNEVPWAAVTADEVAEWNMRAALCKALDRGAHVPCSLLQAMAARCSVSPSSSIAELAALFSNRTCRAAAVADSRGALQGVVTAERLLLLAQQR